MGVDSGNEDGPIWIGVNQFDFVALASKKVYFFGEFLDIDVMEKWICLKNLDADLQILVHVFDVVMLILDVIYRKPISEFFQSYPHI